MKKLMPFVLIAVLFAACSETTENTKPEKTYIMDPHSYALPNEAVVKHLNLDIEVDFEQKTLAGVAKWTIEASEDAKQIQLDVHNLTITNVTLNADEKETTWILGNEPDMLGQPLSIDITPETKQVNIYYSTSPKAEALQWLDPQQTAGKEHPFLFSQSQAILARTWVPCQDSPGIRFTYDATVKVPTNLLAVMSASNPQQKNAEGIYHFKMAQPIPSYLLALSVGDLEFKSIGKRTGVYAEPSMLEASVYEFAEMEDMLVKAEGLYGPYQWERYDVLVLPPSFPFGGMENPRLTFATPTIIAGDRSLTALIAHEMAHSWSGNLVTNATWDDFWLNEGFTVYFENRIMEELYGKEYADMLALLGYQDLQETVERIGETSADTHLKLKLSGRNPDDGMNDIAYEKGHSLLRLLEHTVGRDKWDAFLKQYFTEHAFKTMTTEDFITYLDSNLFKGDSALAEQVQLDKWIYGPGIPDNVIAPISDKFEKVDKQLAQLQSGWLPKELDTEGWTTHEWLHFIRHLPQTMPPKQLELLDKAFGFTKSTNSEIQAVWYVLAIRCDYGPAYPAIEAFLMKVGRRKFLTPIYTAMSKTEAGKKRALDIYAKARANYHSVSINTIDKLLGYEA